MIILPGAEDTVLVFIIIIMPFARPPGWRRRSLAALPLVIINLRLIGNERPANGRASRTPAVLAIINFYTILGRAIIICIAFNTESIERINGIGALVYGRDRRDQNLGKAPIRRIINRGITPPKYGAPVIPGILRAAQAASLSSLGDKSRRFTVPLASPCAATGQIFKWEPVSPGNGRVLGRIRWIKGTHGRDRDLPFINLIPDSRLVFG